MALVADSGGIFGLYSAEDENNSALRKVIEDETGAIHIPAPILSEIDFLLRTRLGVRASITFVADIRDGAFQIEQFEVADLIYCHGLMSKYADLDLGLADASVIALAERLHIDRILTVDERDFRIVRSAKGKPFTLLPADLAT